MSAVFADTSFFIALSHRGDIAHEQAKAALFTTIGTRLITTEWVLVELANAFSKGIGRQRFGSLLRDLRVSPTAEIIPASTELFARGCDLYFSRLDKEWSLTDCISFAVMRDRGLTDALTGDHHFEQAGFRALLR